jgi:hypothetical protein
MTHELVDSHRDLPARRQLRIEDAAFMRRGDRVEIHSNRHGRHERAGRARHGVGRDGFEQVRARERGRKTRGKRGVGSEPDEAIQDHETST